MKTVTSSQKLQHQIDSMRVGGKALAQVKKALADYAEVGRSFIEIERIATDLIAKAGYSPSFSTVEGYSWTTCIMKNEQLCHGIPNEQVVQDGDVITIDVGLISNGYHLDTTVSFGAGKISLKTNRFLEVGRRSLKKAIELVKPGQSVYQLSRAMEKTLLDNGYGAVYQLTGHGVGSELHQEPSIPCVANPEDKQVLLYEGQTLAIEVMYTMGNPYVVLAKDGWTYQTQDKSLSAMFEETVLVTSQGYEILTKSL